MRQRYHHVCACAEELGRGGVDFNEIVTGLVATGAADDISGGGNTTSDGTTIYELR